MLFLDISRNCSLAFRVAEEELGVAALLEVEDVVRGGRPDQLSVITYLAQLYHRLEGEGEVVVRRTSRKLGGRRKGAIQSLMSSQSRRPVSWHGGDITARPVERDNPFTDSNILNTTGALGNLGTLGVTNNNSKPGVVQMRKCKKPKYSNYNSQAKENSPSPSTSSSSSTSASASAAGRRRRPSSYIGTSDSPRPWAPYYSRHGDQILTSPSLLGEERSDSSTLR